MNATSINPFYATRNALATLSHTVEKIVIGNTTLYRGDCFELMPYLSGIDGVVTDPPYGIGYDYRSHDDSPDKYDAFMERLVPSLIRVTANGPCFAWQSQLKADRWHRYFPTGFRIIAACKKYPAGPASDRCYAWDPVIFWSGRSWLKQELPRDWHIVELPRWSDSQGRNPVRCPRPLDQVRYFCNSIRARTILDPFMGSGTTGVAAIQAGKHFVGIERDEVSFNYACDRIRKAWHASRLL